MRAAGCLSLPRRTLDRRHARDARSRRSRPGAPAATAPTRSPACWRKGIAAAPCNDGSDLLRDKALAGVTLVRDERGGLVKGLPYRLDGKGIAIERAAPDLGQHTDRGVARACWATTMPSWTTLAEVGRDLDDAERGRRLIMARAEVQKLMERMAIPAIAAPMFLVSNPALTLACCSEGIMGSFPAHGTRSREEFQAWLDEMQEGMKRLEDAGSKPAPWAVNLVVHASNPRYPGDLELVEKYKVPVVLTSKGAPGDAIKRIHGWGAVALHDIANRRHAEKALEAGVDGVIAVAGGAGGHTGTINPFALMNEVRQLGDHFAIVLAGGLTTGRDVLAAEAMGADLAYIGTRFIATQEAMAAAAHKEMILEHARDRRLPHRLDRRRAGQLADAQPAGRRHRPRRAAHDPARQDRGGAGEQEALEGHLHGGPRRREHRGHPDRGRALPAPDRAIPRRPRR